MGGGKFNLSEQLLSVGTIPHIYSTWSRNLSEGKRIIDGIDYLIVPNGWKERLWHYPWWLGRCYWATGPRNEATGDPTGVGVTYSGINRNYFQNKVNKLLDNTIWDRLLVECGKHSNDGDDIAIPYPSDYISSKDRNTILKFKINLVTQVSDIVDGATIFTGCNVKFFFRPLKDGVTVDFGDGTVSRFVYDSSIGGMEHTYVSRGQYTVKIISDYHVDFDGLLEPTYFKDTSKFEYYSLVYEDIVYDGIDSTTQSPIYHNRTDCHTLLNFYINSYFKDAFKITYIDRTHTTKFGFHINYQKELRTLYIPYGQYRQFRSYIDVCNSSVDSIYIYGSCDTANVYSDHNVTYLRCGKGVAQLHLDNYFADNIDNQYIYLYNYNDVYITDFNFYDRTLNKFSFSRFSKLIVYVQKDILHQLMNKYVDMNFLGV